MRRAAAVDINQGAIVAGLRRMGASVQTLHRVGDGCPDLLVGFRGRNYLFEVKRNAKAQLTPMEKDWHRCWWGQRDVVYSVDDAMHLLLELTKP